jgi:gliding motility-associated-like protein
LVSKLKLLGLVALFLFSLSESKAQVCNGTLGDPVKTFDFGRGAATLGPALPTTTTNYPYFFGTPNDGQYTISQNTFGMHEDAARGWFQFSNHTPNDPTGYMMIVNADNSLGIFYQTPVTGLCPGTTYEFAAWIINILNYNGIKPNVTFNIETSSGVILKTYNTGDIAESNIPTWKQYATTFTTTNETDLVLKIINNGPSGDGNDIALDDITFRPCGPIITSSINNTGVNADLCVGQSRNYNLSANVSAGYNDPVYQWQVLNGTTWVDIVGENGTQTTINFINAVVGTYNYRLSVAERPNINSITCRTSSAVLTINVNDKPNPIAINGGAVCAGGNIQLNVNQGISFQWTGPNGFNSNLQNPTITNVNVNAAGTYTVTVFNSAGCSNTSQTEVKVLPQIFANTNITTATICEDESIGLEASGGTIYSWLPIDGLSDPNIANPIAKPKQTTTYVVTVSNGTCSTTKKIIVTVLKIAMANAGEDKQILTGQSVTLNGNATGDNISYLWTPSLYLDDPRKLNPIATPPIDITYTLTVNSACNISTDDIFIKVYPYPKIDIPNTFTPNGDGINDTWNISFNIAFLNLKLKIVNRVGQLVYESRSAKPWDGKFNGKNLPTGVYYYTLYLKDDFKIYTGWLFLTR